MIEITVLIFLSYLITLVWFAVGYKKVTQINFTDQLATTGFSILIPFRNEAQRIPPLLESLQNIDYPLDKYQLIFIDDESTDNGQKLIQDALANSSIDFKLISNNRLSDSPKKDAITVGIQNADYDWILTTDADCLLLPTWLYAYNQIIVTSAPDFVAAPVRFGIEPIQGFLSYFSQNEAFAILITTIGSYGLNNPILANGANMAYKKDLFKAVRGFEGNLHIASGDDVFMLEKAIKAKAKIRYLKSPLAVVQTATETALKPFLSQRIRWASKTAIVKNYTATGVGLIITITNLWWLVLFVALFFNALNAWYFAVFGLLKMTLDLWYTSRCEKLMGMVPSRYFSLSLVLYPFVIVYVILASLLGGYTWKGRAFKK